MFRRIHNLFSKDLVYILRDNTLVYGVVMPIVLALLFRLFIPSLENIDLTFAVDGSVPNGVVQELAEYGRVTRVDGFESLKQRVLEFDDVPGIYVQDGTYRVLLEGNEASYVHELPGMIIDHLQYGAEPVNIEVQSRGMQSTLVREYGTIMLILMCLIIGGATLGFEIVNEREQGLLPALGVTPMTTADYIVSKSIVGVVLGLGLALLSTAIIMGTGALNYGRLAVASLASVGTGLLFGYLIGMFSANQLSAIALTKVLAVPYVAVPLAAMFAPARLHWLLYPFPNYWSFVSLQRVFLFPTASTFNTNLLAAGITLVVILALLPGMVRALKV